MNIDRLQEVLFEFIETSILPEAPIHMQWVIRGAEILIPNSLKTMIENKQETLRLLGLMDAKGELNIEKTKSFINGAFAKVPEVVFLGIQFTKVDGDKFISLLDKHKGV